MRLRSISKNSSTQLPSIKKEFLREVERDNLLRDLQLRKEALNHIHNNRKKILGKE